MDKDNPCFDCGMCCEGFHLLGDLNFSHTQKSWDRELERRKEYVDKHGPLSDQRFEKWIHEDIVIMTNDELKSLTHITDAAKKRWIENDIIAFRCTLYDPIEKLCTDHDNRPSTCMNFTGVGATTGFTKPCKLAKVTELGSHGEKRINSMNGDKNV